MPVGAPTISTMPTLPPGAEMPAPPPSGATMAAPAPGDR
jgi:hypothetical protein